VDSLSKPIGRPSLETLPGVRNALASCLRRLRSGRMSEDLGKVLIVGYRTMADLLIDERDNRYKKRIKVLWEAHQKGQGVQPEEEDASLQ
jgi:hypothetical protein